ncbi:unnamed protein product [Peronospora belbahrii]|uniref:Uncharacterized protein n=1 Tax=Peronospora belbahrii TaxID=622444 RepID=A0AAU9LE33_9STRA|nr:unnamed protein product [Peronospora belbahrii]
MAALTPATTDPLTRRQRIEHLIQRGDFLANYQQKSQSKAVCRPRTSSSRDTSIVSVCTIRRSSWTPQEDKKLRELVKQLGDKNWSNIALHFSSRDRKRCRERFVNHLAPMLAPLSNVWSPEDDEKLLQLQSKMRSRWARMAQEFRGKSAENVKNRCLLLARRTAEKRPRRGSPQRWNAVEKEKLRSMVQTHGTGNWLFIASQLSGRTDSQCLQQWYRTLDDKVVKGRGTWTETEDRVLMEKVAEIGRKWTQVAMFLPGRVGNQCRERFLNQLDPSINKAPWTKAEDELLIKAVNKYAARWSLIAEELPGRCENAIKNHWYSRERCRMLAAASWGAEPAMHDGINKRRCL